MQKRGTGRPANAHREICSWESPQSQVKCGLLKEKEGGAVGHCGESKSGAGEGDSGHQQKRLAVGSKGDLFSACHLDSTFQSPAETRGQRDESLRSGGAAPPRL